MRESAMRHIGVTRLTSRPVKLWPEGMNLDGRTWTEEDADRVLGSDLIVWLTRLERDYVPNARPPMGSVKPTLAMARRHVEGQMTGAAARAIRGCGQRAMLGVR